MDSKKEEAEKWINDLEDRVMETNQAEQRRGKKIMQIENSLQKKKKRENSLQELRDSIKHNNICIAGISTKKTETKGQKIYFKN